MVITFLCADLPGAFEAHAAPGSLPFETSAESAQVLSPTWGMLRLHCILTP